MFLRPTWEKEMIFSKFTRLTKGMLLALAGLVLILTACSSGAGAQPPPPIPTAQTEPGVAPGQTQAPRTRTTIPTPIPGDPNQPVSNETPIAPAPQNNARITIAGRVTNDKDEPIAGARLAFTKSSVPVPEMAYLTNSNGQYKITAPRGEFTLAVYADGYAPQERNIDARESSQTEIDFVLQAQR